MRCLAIDHGVEGVWFERQIFRVTLDKDQSVNLMPLPAKTDSGRIQIQGGVALRLHCSREVGRSASVTAAYFKNILSPQLQLRGDMMIKLGAGTIHFVFGGERDVHRWFLFVSVVEEQDFFATKSPGEQGIPKPPEGFANATNRKKMINDRHVN